MRVYVLWICANVHAVSRYICDLYNLHKVSFFSIIIAVHSTSTLCTERGGGRWRKKGRKREREREREHREEEREINLFLMKHRFCSVSQSSTSSWPSLPTGWGTLPSPPSSRESLSSSTSKSHPLFFLYMVHAVYSRGWSFGRGGGDGEMGATHLQLLVCMQYYRTWCTVASQPATHHVPV